MSACTKCGSECVRCTQERLLADRYGAGFSAGIEHARKHLATESLTLESWRAVWAAIDPDRTPTKAARKTAALVLHRLRPLKGAQ